MKRDYDIEPFVLEATESECVPRDQREELMQTVMAYLTDFDVYLEQPLFVLSFDDMIGYIRFAGSRFDDH